MRILLSLGIKFYQKFLSPHKGFRCAHLAFEKKGLSCSEAIRRIIMDKGLFGGWGDIRKRLDGCSDAADKLKKDKKRKNSKCGSCDTRDMDRCSDGIYCMPLLPKNKGCGDSCDFGSCDL